MKIVEHEIIFAQKLWSEWVIRIGKTFLQKGDYVNEGREMTCSLYGYDEGVVLFKPTKARENQFRLTKEEAVSYLVGGNHKYPEDHGFLLHPWENVRFENAGFIFKNDYAVAMGNYFFVDMKKEELKVEFTLGYFRSEGGTLKINLHHSSLPYCSR